MNGIDWEEIRIDAEKLIKKPFPWASNEKTSEKRLSGLNRNSWE